MLHQPLQHISADTHRKGKKKTSCATASGMTHKCKMRASLKDFSWEAESPSKWWIFVMGLIFLGVATMWTAIVTCLPLLAPHLIQIVKAALSI